MTEILFYHLQRQPLEKVLPVLLEKSLAKGWHATIEVVSDERMKALDDQLWIYKDDSFLPHATEDDPEAATQPIIIAKDSKNRNGSKIRFLIEGADIPEDKTDYERLVVMIDGRDDASLQRARNQWKSLKEAKLVATYWQQDDQGRWAKVA